MPFTFQSSTDAYKSGLFNDTIKKIIKNYDEIKNVVLPTLGEERRKSYSPFFPINEKTGKILQVPIEEVNYDDFTVSYYEDGELKSKSVLDGNCKLQWKVDWAMRWAAFGVDYEMCGKDLTDSYSLSSKICRIIGSKPPENLIYELFLDENAEKISKSKGNGISIDDWLKYSIEESLSMFMYQRPTTAKKLFFDVIPKNTDEYLSHVNKFNSDDQNADNPAWHIHKSVNPLYSSKINYSLILNVISVCKSEDPSVIFGLIKNYQSKFHTDIPDDNNLALLTKTACIYLNSNNGGTLFDDEEKTFVQSKFNRAAVFPGTMWHSAVACTDAKLRFVLNLNYEEND